MVGESTDARHSVAWLPAMRWLTCVVLWAVAASWLLPHLNLPLRAIGPFGLAAAIARSVVELLRFTRRPVSPSLVGLSLVADMALVTVLLRLTGGPFNPFIVIYGVYAWLAAETVNPRWGQLAGMVALLGVGWLVFEEIQAGPVEHDRLIDLPGHVAVIWLAAAAAS